LLGTFLAKGANPPFGGVYIWLFEHIPGFVMLRDPTKFYLYIAIGYSVLIPFTLYSLAYSELRITNWYKKSIRYPLSVIIVLIFAAYWLFTLRALFTGQAAGNFRPLLLTHEYQKLHDLLVNDNKSSRILWIPSADKFMYGSVIHPVLFADTLWKNASSGALLNASGTPEFFNTLQNAGVRYIIVPKDLEKRIFLSDYRFDNNQREALIHALDQTGLRKLPEFQELAVYENPTYEFQLVVPDYVEKQKYWAIIGAYLSACTLVVTIGSMFIVFRKFNYL